MGRLSLATQITPNTPSVSTIEIYPDSADKKVKMIDENGIVNSMTPDGWRDRPILYNGAFEFWQRQVPATVTTYSNVGGRLYSADRWFISNENTSVTAARVDTETSKEAGIGTRFYGQFVKITTTGKMLVGQALGATSIMNLRGNTVRLQFNIKASTALTLRIGLIQLAAAGTVDTIPINAGTFVTAWGANATDPTLGSNLAYITPNANSADGGVISGNAMNCAATTSWKRFSCTFSPPNDCHNLIIAIWTDSQFTAAQSFSISEVGLYEGPEIRTNFVPYASILELLRVQKYYQKTFPLNIAPAQSGGLAGSLRGSVEIAGAVATSSTMQWYFRVPMRVAPTTVTFYNPSAANAYVRNVAAASDATVTSQANASEFSLDVNCTGLSGWTAGQELKVHVTADAEL
jgi:hypothetical protein